jgi:hypothetical protein
MRARRGRPPAGAVLAAAAALVFAAQGAAAGPVLVVEGAGGQQIARLPLGAGGHWCLSWRHSVTQGAVADCFRAGPEGEMVLDRSFLHDAAAGLGHTPGRGRLVSAPAGGYWIEGLEAPVPGGVLPLRVGGAGVGHRLTAGAEPWVAPPAGTGAEPGAAAGLDLSALANGRRVLLRLSGP